MASEAEVLARVTALLAADPVCLGRVNKVTIAAIAQIVAYREPVPDSDVLAERAACLGVIAAVGQRLLDLHDAADGGADDFGAGVDPEAVAHEVLRLGEAARSIGLGLHRTGE